jgi:thiazole synthase
MTVTVNGEKKEIPAGLTVTKLLAHLELNPARVAIERNLDILPRNRWNDTPVEPNDSYEIVQLVGGG